MDWTGDYMLYSQKNTKMWDTGTFVNCSNLYHWKSDFEKSGGKGKTMLAGSGRGAAFGEPVGLFLSVRTQYERIYGGSQYPV